MFTLINSFSLKKKQMGENCLTVFSLLAQCLAMLLSYIFFIHVCMCVYVMYACINAHAHLIKLLLLLLFLLLSLNFLLSNLQM